ncbi:MAG: polysaccharide deacetylase family protein [Oscillospiraceae bacterium]|jgi:peptidoglycan/xylan/chitin deacetylase (PgdA/CDA1 family)|nr:polysaccharide deacetylase family protein [Oscillospiraceae bacterium]
MIKRLLYAFVAVILIAATLSSCGGNGVPATSPTPDVSPSAEVSPSPTPELSPSPSPVVSPTADPTLVAWNGAVEHVFFHTLITYPELAFHGPNAKGNDDWMVTVPEFNKIIQSLYDKNFIIVNMNDVWSEYTNANGAQRMKQNTLYVPAGKKPLIISFDDISYYPSYIGDGYPTKLILGQDGDIWAYAVDPRGNTVISQDIDAIPLLDRFIEEHPDFSLNGAKGMLCMTGYEGLFGYRTQVNSYGNTPEEETRRQAEILRVKPIIARLRETGWYFASHTWGHINLGSASFETLKADTKRWKDQVEPLLGSTTILVYPHGARPDSSTGGDVWVNNAGTEVKWLLDQGFRMFCSVGPNYFTKIRDDVPALMCDRIDIDGIKLRGDPEKLIRFYDARLVWDDARIVDNDKFKRAW